MKFIRQRALAILVSILALTIGSAAVAAPVQINCTLAGSTIRLMPLDGGPASHTIPTARAELFYRSDSGSLGLSGETHYDCTGATGALGAGSLKFTSMGQGAVQTSGPPAANAVTVRLADGTLIGASNGWPYPPKGGAVSIPVDFLGASPGASFRVSLGSSLQKRTPPGVAWDIKPSSSITITVEPAAAAADPARMQKAAAIAALLGVSFERAFLVLEALGL